MKSDITTHKAFNLKDQLRRIHNESQKIRHLKSQDIKFSEPLLWRGKDAIIYPRTITMVQGKTGAHKSRFTQAICSTLISSQPQLNNPLGLIRSSNENLAVLYVDTERNITDQYPYALQRILLDAGFKKEDNPEHFKFISLLTHDRKHRFELLKGVLDACRKKTVKHLVVILDVVTDCIMNFNNPEEALMLNDLMNKYINEYDVSFIIIIHENPGTEKARGHVGTELQNKASSVIQISFDSKNPNLLVINNKKNRNAKPFVSFNAFYNEQTKRLEESAESNIYQISNNVVKAPVNDVKDFIGKHLKSKTSKTELFNLLSKEFDCATRTIEDRVEDILKNPNITVKEKDYCLRKFKEGKKVMFKLQKIATAEQPSN